MRKYIAFVLIVSLPILFLASCDGGAGNGQGNLNVYDVLTNIEIVGGLDTDCPENANLKLSLQIKGNEISGTAQLFGFDNVGEAVEILGVKEDNVFTLQTFKVIAFGESAEFGGGIVTDSLQFTFNHFQGLLIDSVDDETGSRIEGDVSGNVWKNLLDAVVCDAEFTGEFTGEAKSPEGCLSNAELTLDENRACPAESISRMCDNVIRFCPIPVPSPAPIPTPPPGDFIIDNTCEAGGCFTVTNCNLAPILTNLVIGPNGGISGNLFSPDGEHFACF